MALAVYITPSTSLTPFSSMSPGTIFVDTAGSIYLVLQPDAASPKNAVNVNTGLQAMVPPGGTYQVLTVVSPAQLQQA